MSRAHTSGGKELYLFCPKHRFTPSIITGYPAINTTCIRPEMSRAHTSGGKKNSIFSCPKCNYTLYNYASVDRTGYFSYAPQRVAIPPVI